MLHRYLNIYTIVSLVACLVLTACNKADDIDGQEYVTDLPSVRVIYSVSGLGDLSYTDNIHYGVWQAKVKYGEQQLNVEICSPETMELAEMAIQDWYDNRYARKQLLVLGSPQYADLFDRHPEWTSEKDAEVFILDCERTDLDLYTWFLPLYGVNYLAGEVIQAMGIDKLAMVLSNDQDYAIAEAAKGFALGYYDMGGEISLDDVYYLSREAFGGYDTPDSLYHLCHQLDRDGYQFVYPAQGGSEQGAFRYTRNNTPLNPNGMFYTCGFDVDKQDYSRQVAFSLIKHNDLAVCEFISDWAEGKELEKHRVTGLGTGYVSIKVADRFAGTITLTDDQIDELRQKAIIAEQQHYEKK